jgi:hypothetical protein
VYRKDWVNRLGVKKHRNAQDWALTWTVTLESGERGPRGTDDAGSFQVAGAGTVAQTTCS